MAKAMEVRRRDTIWNHELKSRKQIVKGLADCARRYGSSLLPGKGEYRAVWRNRSAARFFPFQESRKSLGHPWPERYKTIFPKLCLANDQQLVFNIDILAAQPRYFPDAKPYAIQNRKDHPVDFSTGQCARITG